MEQIKAQTLNRALALLNAAGCQYAVIDTDGVKHGDLEVCAPEEKKRRSDLAFPIGTIKAYIEPYINDLAVGSVASVPILDYGDHRIQSGIINHATRIWGKGSVTTTIVRGSEVVEVLRVQ